MKVAGIILAVALFLAILVLILFNWPVKVPEKDFEYGVTYSARYAENIGLDKKKTFEAILSDLDVKFVRIPIYWDRVEKNKDEYDFSEIDWQLEMAQAYKAKVILVVGQKVPRWPECFIPEWIGNDTGIRMQELGEFVDIVAKRYKGNNTVYYWQVENEPFLPFGNCPEFNPDLLDLEIATVRLNDPNRKILITDSGELSLWIPAAKRADIFGTTLYRSVVTEKFGGLAFDYPIGPNFFKLKHWLIKKFADQENIMIVELQGEPWLDGWTVDQPLTDQLDSMNAEKLRENVEFAKKTGFSPILVWGAEWWYWLKTEKNDPSLWNKAKDLFKD